MSPAFSVYGIFQHNEIGRGSEDEVEGSRGLGLLHQQAQVASGVLCTHRCPACKYYTKSDSNSGLSWSNIMMQYNALVKEGINWYNKIVSKENQDSMQMRKIMEELNSFFNEKMRLLMTINNHTIDVESEQFCPLNQQEIASLVPCGKVKANQLINELMKEGYLETLRTKGRYCLTTKGKEILNKVQ